MLSGKMTSLLFLRDGILRACHKSRYKGETINVQLQNNLSENNQYSLAWTNSSGRYGWSSKGCIRCRRRLTNYVLPIQQRAGTYWYHPHPHMATARQVFMGLAGMFIVKMMRKHHLIFHPEKMKFH